MAVATAAATVRVPTKYSAAAVVRVVREVLTMACAAEEIASPARRGVSRGDDA